MKKIFCAVILLWLSAHAVIASAWGIGPICTDDKLRAELKSQRDAVILTSASAKLLPTHNEPGSKFELTYTLRFAAKNQYLTWPAHLGDWRGNYLKTYPREFIFEAAKDYEYIVEFDSANEPWGDMEAGLFGKNIYRTRQDLNKGKAFRSEFVEISFTAGDEWCYGARTIQIPLKKILANKSSAP